ncbi:RNA polymerase sigma-54 factor [Sesbania bispinosa]|nr:RNA polymerase sigma-54 factor [Sesbania bispinosa]
MGTSPLEKSQLLNTSPHHLMIPQILILSKSNQILQMPTSPMNHKLAITSS